MNSKNLMPNRFNTVSYILLFFLLSSCTQLSKACPSQPPADLSGALAYAEDDKLVFQFPLDKLGRDVRPFPAIFCTSGGSDSARQYHAAEDYHLPAGTPVYAIADGRISFSGPMGGYGWLIIIDHPQANIYSLYGHLSPSRWRLESGVVEKGDLIAYLGDPDENGGSPENPLIPHLHFGIRAGQRTDYPGMGEWRWQAGWIKPCPQDLGWLQPSGVITNQEIPNGGYPEPVAGIFEKWGVELAFFSVYLFGAAFVFLSAIKKRKPIVPLMYGGLMVVAGWVLFSKGARISYALFVIAILSFGFAIYQYVHQPKDSPTSDRRI